MRSLAHVEGEVDVFLLGEEQDEEVVTCLTLLDGRVQADLLAKNWMNGNIMKEKKCCKAENEEPTYHKEHLPLVLVWQQEESQHGGVGDLVVKSFTMKVKKSRVDSDVVSERE